MSQNQLRLLAHHLVSQYGFEKSAKSICPLYRLMRMRCGGMDVINARRAIHEALEIAQE